MRDSKLTITAVIACLAVFLTASPAKSEECSFSSPEDKKKFSENVSSLVASSWKTWQDNIIIDGVEVDSSSGVMTPGDMAGPVFTMTKVLKDMEKEGTSGGHAACLVVVANALEEGMRVWQREYKNNNIPFPQGASCVYTLPRCNNVPVTVVSGRSGGDVKMTEDALYNYMRYASPSESEDTLLVFRAAAKAVSRSFKEWKASCSIVGITASGGIAPQPGPMGTGPGPVRGAKGNGGRLAGAYIEAGKIYGYMMEYLDEVTSD